MGRSHEIMGGFGQEQRGPFTVTASAGDYLSLDRAAKEQTYEHDAEVLFDLLSMNIPSATFDRLMAKLTEHFGKRYPGV